MAPASTTLKKPWLDQRLAAEKAGTLGIQGELVSQVIRLYTGFLQGFYKSHCYIYIYTYTLSLKGGGKGAAAESTMDAGILAAGSF